MIGTAFSSALASMICGLFGNLPFALAPGLGLSTYMSAGLAHVSPDSLTFSSLVFKVDDSLVNVPETEGWRTALGACAVSGIIQMYTLMRFFDFTYMLVIG